MQYSLDKTPITVAMKCQTQFVIRYVFQRSLLYFVVHHLTASLFLFATSHMYTDKTC